MSGWRILILNHRRLALLLILCALFMKAAVPSGYMIGGNSKTLTVQICSDGLGAATPRQIVIPLKDGPENAPGHSTKADGTCAFTSLSMAGMAGADAALLEVALAFILVLGFAATVIPRIAPTPYLRPPLRGPPAIS